MQTSPDGPHQQWGLQKADSFEEFASTLQAQLHQAQSRWGLRLIVFHRASGDDIPNLAKLFAAHVLPIAGSLAVRLKIAGVYTSTPHLWR